MLRRVCPQCSPRKIAHKSPLTFPFEGSVPNAPPMLLVPRSEGSVPKVHMAYTLVAGGDMLPTRAFHISGSPSEGFTIHHQGTYPAVLLMDDDEKGDSQTLMMQDGKRVNCSYEMEIRISAAHWDNGRPS